jgi:hypothetical protein
MQPSVTGGADRTEHRQSLTEARAAFVEQVSGVVPT